MIYTNPQLMGVEERTESRGVLDRHLAPSVLECGRLLACFDLALLSRYVSGDRLLGFEAGNRALVAVLPQVGQATETKEQP